MGQGTDNLESKSRQKEETYGQKLVQKPLLS